MKLPLNSLIAVSHKVLLIVLYQPNLGIKAKKYIYICTLHIIIYTICLSLFKEIIRICVCNSRNVQYMGILISFKYIHTDAYECKCGPLHVQSSKYSTTMEMKKKTFFHFDVILR